MRACDHQRPSAGNEGGIDVVLAKSHIGAIGSIEDVRRGVTVHDRQEDECDQARRIRDDAIDVYAFADELLLYEPA